MAALLVLAQWLVPWSAGSNPSEARVDTAGVRPAPVPAAVAQDPVDIAADEIDADGDYRIVVDQVDDEIDVETNLDITLRKPSRRVGNVIYEYYLTDWFLVVPAAATDLEVRDPAGALAFSFEESEVSGLSVVVVGLRRNLFNGRSADITISYSLPSAPPPVDLADTSGLALEEQVVVNDATAGWSFFSDPGLDSWTATIELPPGFEEAGLDDSVTWTEAVSETDPAVRTLEASGESFAYDFVVIENDSAMVETSAGFDGKEVTVRYWPGDEPWRDRVVDQITGNLPNLIELVDRPWPERSLVVQESAETLGTTYGGWYTSRDHHITIGPSVDANLILHELAHVWFNFETFHDRWLIEGLAEEFATLAASDPGDDDPGDDGSTASTDGVSLSSRYATPLRSWGWQDLGADYTEEEWKEATEREAWGYDASWHTIRRTREIIGLDAFSEVTSAALEGRRSYPGPGDEGGDDEDGGGVGNNGGPPWEEFLDLAAEHGPDDELDELYADWVEGGMTERFEARAAQRERFGAVTENLDGWILPEAVRRPMREWRFGAAATALDATSRFADSLDSQATALGTVGLSVPDDAAQRLAAIDQVDDIAAYGRELEGEVDAIVAFETSADDISIIERIGLFGSDFEEHQAAARVAFLAGDFEDASSSIEEGDDLLEAAPGRGRTRVLVATAVVVAMIVVLSWFRRRRRKRRPDLELAPGPVRSAV